VTSTYSFFFSEVFTGVNATTYPEQSTKYKGEKMRKRMDGFISRIARVGLAN